MLFKIVTALLVLAITLVTTGLAAAEPPAFPPRMIVPLWQRNISNNWPPREGAPGLVLSDLLRTSDDRLILLGTVDGKPSLFVGPDNSGPGKTVPLAIVGNNLRIAEAKDGGFWIGGTRNEHYEGLGSSSVSEGYLVKLDKDGGVVFERGFGTGRHRTIESLASLPSGDVIVSGKDNSTNWLAMISPQGQVEWERFVGVGRGTSVTVAHDTIYLAGLDAVSEAHNGYHEDIVLWSLDTKAGNVRDRLIVRPHVTNAKYLFVGTIKIRHSADAIYVSSSGLNLGPDIPIEVAKIGFDGQSLWRTELGQTVQRLPTGGSRSCLSPGIALLDNSDLLVACAIGDQGSVFRLGSITGDTKQASFLLPACNYGLSVALFLTQISPRSMRILGTRPENVYKESCTWLGTIPVPD